MHFVHVLLASQDNGWQDGVHEQRGSAVQNHNLQQFAGVGPENQIGEHPMMTESENYALKLKQNLLSVLSEQRNNGFRSKEPKAIPDADDEAKKMKDLKERMACWIAGHNLRNGGAGLPVNETTAKEYTSKAFLDNKARASMQGMFREDQWEFDKNGMMRATMKSNSGGEPYKLYLFPFGLEDALRKIKDGDTDYSGLATQVVRGNISPFCTCPNFINQNAGPRGANRQLLNPAGSKSDKANWGLCKHLYFPVETFPFLQSTIAKKLKDGYYDYEQVQKKANDGRVRAFLNEAETGVKPILILENDELIKAAMDRADAVKALEANEDAGRLFEAFGKAVSEAFPESEVPHSITESMMGLALDVANSMFEACAELDESIVNEKGFLNALLLRHKAAEKSGVAGGEAIEKKIEDYLKSIGVDYDCFIKYWNGRDKADDRLAAILGKKPSEWGDGDVMTPAMQSKVFRLVDGIVKEYKKSKLGSSPGQTPYKMVAEVHPFFCVGESR
jgi:hypothetical protein